MTQWLYWISDLLSIVVIALCLISKVPQILCLVKSGRATGLSLKGLLLELSSYTVTMMYNYTNQYALLLYLEYPIIIIQEYVLIWFVMYYQNYKLAVILSVVMLYISITLAFAVNLINKFLLSLLLPLTVPGSAISKILQLMEIISKKNADSVSRLTWFLSFFTNAARIYTIYLGSADISLLLNFIISSFLSGAVLASAVYYQKHSSGKKVG